MMYPHCLRLVSLFLALSYSDWLLAQVPDPNSSPQANPRGKPEQANLTSSHGLEIEDHTASMFDTPHTSPATISVDDLSHAVPRGALKQFQKATTCRRKGDLQGAVEHLNQAIAIDPQFWGAVNDLGSAYFYLNKLDLAIQQFQKVIDMNPHEKIGYANLAIALLHKEDAEGAERAAREEIKLDHASTLGHLLLGVSMIVQKRFTDETQHNLEMAVREFPVARIMLAMGFVETLRFDRAKEELNRYLPDGNAAGIELAKEWLDYIDRTTASPRPMQVWSLPIDPAETQGP
jgi:tetratricopeptide (TPR) repeat protein